jgi:Protein of unknown function (DUF2848)
MTARAINFSVSHGDSVENRPIVLNGTAMFCGTFPAKGGIRPSRRFAFELFDPVLGRRLRHSYSIVALPIAG